MILLLVHYNFILHYFGFNVYAVIYVAYLCRDAQIFKNWGDPKKKNQKKEELVTEKLIYSEYYGNSLHGYGTCISAWTKKIIFILDHQV